MISILIPSYNVNVTPLVRSLEKQLSQIDQKAEIIVLDDASNYNYKLQNETISELPFVKYQYLSQNVGRFNIRLKLASLASYEWLLFIDGDSEIINDNFLSIYLNEKENNKDVITGGRIYTSKPPLDCLLRLHWKYGIVRENIQSNKTGFMTNNFMIRKEVFNQIHLSDTWDQYGHEDTAIGIALEKLNYRIITINNPVLHAQLEPSDVFLKKSEQALHNIPMLVQSLGSDIVAKHIKIYKWLLIIQQFRIGGIIEKIYYLLQNRIQKNLASCHPSLFYFDFYRIVYLFKTVMF
jgi:Glycosyltransferases, probably involved in cell wall biogenesis